MTCAFTPNLQGLWIGLLSGVIVQTLILSYIKWRTDWDEQVNKASERLRRWFLNPDKVGCKGISSSDQSFKPQPRFGLVYLYLARTAVRFDITNFWRDTLASTILFLDSHFIAAWLLQNSVLGSHFLVPLQLFGDRAAEKNSFSAAVVLGSINYDAEVANADCGEAYG
ncbi:hypothetical protein D5086_023859 [Populus alba]|uniref:Uncharacterized protein n=1 Tax=Populus alba TaxID=43335 RepID=A0ACC4BB00_POPAL